MSRKGSSPLHSFSHGTSGVAQGGRMAVTVQRQCASVVTERAQDACVGSSIENGATILPFDLRQRDCQRALGATSPVWWRQEPSHVAMQARSTCHHPIQYRVIVAQGSEGNDKNQRMSCTPASQGVSTSQQMSKSMLRLSCDLAVVGGVRLRQIALLFASLCFMPMTKSAIKRWMADSGSPLPTQEERLQPLRALTPATACPIDGDDPMGTDHWVMVVQDAHDRILMTREVASEHGADAQPLLQH